MLKHIENAKSNMHNSINGSSKKCMRTKLQSQILAKLKSRKSATLMTQIILIIAQQTVINILMQVMIFISVKKLQKHGRY